MDGAGLRSLTWSAAFSRNSDRNLLFRAHKLLKSRSTGQITDSRVPDALLSLTLSSAVLQNLHSSLHDGFKKCPEADAEEAADTLNIQLKLHRRTHGHGQHEVQVAALIHSLQQEENTSHRNLYKVRKRFSIIQGYYINIKYNTNMFKNIVGLNQWLNYYTSHPISFIKMYICIERV